jgi:hypothetical protein
LKSFELNSKLHFFWPEFSVNLTRIGPKEDGGYLVPLEMLPKITSLISFGVNVDWRFEQELNDDFKISIEMFDCSLVFRLVILFCIKGVAKFLLFKSNLNELSGRFKRIYSYFHFINRTNVSLSQLLITAGTAEQIFSRSKFNALLKCDIEGAEYNIFEPLLLHKDKFDLIILELHNVINNVERLAQFFNDLKNDFALIHLHVNNYYPPTIDGFPDIVEVTFARRSCLTKTLLRPNSLPIHGLDYANVKNKSEFQVFPPTIKI